MRWRPAALAGGIPQGAPSAPRGDVLADATFTDLWACYKVFRAEFIKAVAIEQNRWSCDAEFSAKLAHMGCRFYEVPISYTARSWAQGKKIHWTRDGIHAVGHAFHHRAGTCGWGNRLSPASR